MVIEGKKKLKNRKVNREEKALVGILEESG